MERSPSCCICPRSFAAHKGRLRRLPIPVRLRPTRQSPPRPANPPSKQFTRIPPEAAGSRWNMKENSPDPAVPQVAAASSRSLRLPAAETPPDSLSLCLQPCRQLSSPKLACSANRLVLRRAFCRPAERRTAQFVSSAERLRPAVVAFKERTLLTHSKPETQNASPPPPCGQRPNPSDPVRPSRNPELGTRNRRSAPRLYRRLSGTNRRGAPARPSFRSPVVLFVPWSFLSSIAANAVGIGSAIA